MTQGRYSRDQIHPMSKRQRFFHISTWRNHNWAACAFWVDDETGVVSPSTRPSCDNVQPEVWRFWQGEMHWALGIGVSRDHSSHTISLSQEACICNLVECFGLQNAAIVTTPLAPGATLTKDQCTATAEELQDVHNNKQSYRLLTICSTRYTTRH